MDSVFQQLQHAHLCVGVINMGQVAPACAHTDCRHIHLRCETCVYWCRVGVNVIFCMAFIEQLYNIQIY